MLTNKLTSYLTNDQPTTNQQLTTNEDIIYKTKDIFTYEIAFEKIWEAYPNRKNQSKKKAYEAYKKEIKGRVPIKDILNVIEKQKKSKAWVKDSGEFIPHFSTWINGRMWESESDADSQKPVGIVCKKCKSPTTSITEGLCRKCYNES